MNMIATWALCVGLATGQVGPTTGAEPPLDDAAVTRLVAQLGADKLIERDEAMLRLWRAGVAIEPALQRATTSSDTEIRFRARAILDRFQYGIFVDTSPEVVALIQRFRAGDPQSRQEVLKLLGERQQFDTLLALIRTENDENQRRAWFQIFLQEPTGIISQLVLADRLGEVERLLESAGSSPEAALVWASFLATSGELESRIARYRDKAAGGDVTASRLLAYLLRASGDLPGAYDAAERAGDKPLQRALAYERGDWGTVARLHDQGIVDPPMPLLNSRGITGPNRQIELLGYSAAFHRLAGNGEQFRAQVAAIKKLAENNPKNTSLAWYCAESLLINDLTEDALELMKVGNPVARFDLLCYQHRYDDAFAWANWKPGVEVNDAWFDALPAIVINAGTARQNRFRLAVYLTRAIHHLGFKEDARRLLSYLVELAQQTQPAKHQTSADPMWVLLGTTELRMGLKEAGYEHLGKVLGGGEQYHYLRNIFGSRAGEAEAWFRYLLVSEKQPTPGQILLQIDRRLAWSRDVSTDTADLEKVVAGIADVVKDLDAGLQGTIRLGLASTCLIRKRPDLARQLLAPVVDKAPGAKLRWAETLFEQKQWAEASAAYEVAWQAERQQLAALWLSGYCAIQAGQKEQGEKRQRQADSLALTGVARHGLAAALAARGLAAEAREQWERLVRTGPFEHLELNEGARFLADAVQGAEPRRAADLWERHMLANLRIFYSFLEYESYVRYPWQIHKARAQAALADEDLPRAQRELDAATALAPNDVRLVEHLAMFFDQARQAEIMNRLFERTAGHFEQMIEKFPNGPEFHNNLAWMSARSHRRLEDARKWSERATQLAPDEPNYLDTLAEVHFHLGNRDEAIRHSRRCLELAPRDATLRKQAERFAKAPLPVGPVTALVDEE